MEEMHAQGATEYLVLLAVVLIVALVSVALLGFFPGMASDARMTQSQTYWRGSAPISIIEMDAVTDGVNTGYAFPYLRIRNIGAYPVRITKVLAGTNSLTQFHCSAPVCGSDGLANLSTYYYLAPGEETYFAWGVAYNVNDRQIAIYTGASGSYTIGGASTGCDISSPYGTTVVKDFGFEYIEYIDGQQITKRQVGKELAIKCRKYN